MQKLIALLVPAVALAGCRGCEDPPTAIAPQIYVDVCKTPEKKVGDKLIGGFEDCGYAFGARDISVVAEQVFKVTNPSSVELTLENVELVGDPAFEIKLAPETIAPGLTADIVISMWPRVEGDVESTLYILSDANNTQQTPESKSLVTIPLTATGVDNGLPDIEITPSDCDFGGTAVGGVKLCNVTVKNTGNRGLTLFSVEFVPPGDDPEGPRFEVPDDSVLEPFAFTGRPPAVTEEIAPGTPVVMPIRFTPDALGNYQGKLEVRSNDPDEEIITLALAGIAVPPPVCEVAIRSVNGVEGTIEIEPLDNVVLTLANSTPGSADGTVAGYQWQITERPTGSQVALQGPDAMDTGFEFNGGANLGIDLVGEYCVSAVVSDAIGTESINECSLCFEAVPKDSFLAQLTWDTPEDDIDLHFTRQHTDGSYCLSQGQGDAAAGALHATSCANGLDCNYATCKAPGPSTPNPGHVDWDGDGERSEGDPSLDIDDTDGFGPENSNVDAMLPGFYLIAVNGYDVANVSGATVRLFVHGRIAAERYVELEQSDWAEIALVRWPDGVTTTRPCIEDLTDGVSGDELEDCDALEQEQ